MLSCPARRVAIRQLSGISFCNGTQYAHHTIPERKNIRGIKKKPILQTNRDLPQVQLVPPAQLGLHEGGEETEEDADCFF